MSPIYSGRTYAKQKQLTYKRNGDVVGQDRKYEEHNKNSVVYETSCDAFGGKGAEQKGRWQWGELTVGVTDGNEHQLDVNGVFGETLHWYRSILEERGIGICDDFV